MSLLTLCILETTKGVLWKTVKSQMRCCELTTLVGKEFKPYIFVTDLGSGGESVKKLETKIFVGNTATNTAKTELIKVGSAIFLS